MKPLLWRDVSRRTRSQSDPSGSQALFCWDHYINHRITEWITARIFAPLSVGIYRNAIMKGEPLQTAERMISSSASSSRKMPQQQHTLDLNSYIHTSGYIQCFKATTERWTRTLQKIHSDRRVQKWHLWRCTAIFEKLAFGCKTESQNKSSFNICCISDVETLKMCWGVYARWVHFKEICEHDSSCSPCVLYTGN